MKMTLVYRAKDFLNDIRAYWRTPAKGDFVAYKEYLMLSIGWLGMRFATVFGISFSVNNPFTAMTLNMTHKDLLLFSYICTAIGYALAPVNAYIIDNLRSRVGKYKVYIKLGIPAGILSLFALFYPYEKLSYWPMVISLFFIGQIQGYVNQWYNTGVSNLVYVISPNSQERVKIMMVSSLVHNFAPTLTGFLIPVLSDVFAGGDLYNIKTYRMVYPAIIIIGVIMSMSAYYGVEERIVQPRSQVTSVGLFDALKAVSGNKLFWIKCTDSWNNFMEECKNILMQWVFYYGKAGSMTLYGIIDTVSYNSSMWAMLFSPWMIGKLGKRGFKLVKNISQIFITLGLALTYKKSIWFIGIFFFLNRFWDTTEIIDRSIESDIRDYQQYISGERIDGAFGVVETYVGGAIGALTNLFVPWIYRRNGFDGTDYSVLEVYKNYDDKKPISAQEKNPGCVLYPLLDNLMKISLVGAILDVIPWVFYDLTDTQQKSIIRCIRIRSAAEDKKAGVLTDDLYCEACEAIFYADEYLCKEKSALPDRKTAGKSAVKEAKTYNEEIEIAGFVNKELNRFTTDFGKELLAFCKNITGYGKEDFFNHYNDIFSSAAALPEGKTKEEKTNRSDAVYAAKSIRKVKKYIKKYYPDGLKEFSYTDFEAAFDLPEETKEERRAKRAIIKKEKSERKIYGKVMKPYLFAERIANLAECYADIDSFTAEYQAAAERLENEKEKHRLEEEAKAAARKAEAQSRTIKRRK